MFILYYSLCRGKNEVIVLKILLPMQKNCKSGKEIVITGVNIGTYDNQNKTFYKSY